MAHRFLRKRLRVLIVDDDATLRELGHRIVSQVDHAHVDSEADSAETALERLGSRRTDVVLMDWSMPGLDGIAATAKVLDLDPGARVVGWTSTTDAAIHAGFRSAGAVAVFVKSDVAGLVRFLERLSQAARA